MVPATGERKKAGMVYQFKMEEFMKSQPTENVQYLATLQQTQGTYLIVPTPFRFADARQGLMNSSTSAKASGQTTPL
jgi:hypothetical protein